MNDPAVEPGEPELEPGPEAQSGHFAHLDIELPWRRLHPLSPLLRGGLFLLVVLGIIVTNMRDRILELFIAEEYLQAIGPNEGDLINFLIAQQLIIWVLLALVVVILLIVTFSWLSWRVASFRITSEAVESRWGVIFKQHRRAPLDRIQSVNLHRSLLARVFGLTQVDIQTAGQGGKVALQYLGHADAKRVRQQILLAARVTRGEHIDGSVVASEVRDGGVAAIINEDRAVSPAVDPSGRAYSAPTNSIDSRLSDLVDFDIDPTAKESGSLVKVPLGRLTASILLGTELFVMAMLVIGVVLIGILSSAFLFAGLIPVVLIAVGLLIGQFNKGFNFSLSRAVDGVRIGAGLTSTTTETIPFGRVHAIEAQQPLGWRPFGWWKVRITTAGHSLSQGGQNKLQNTVLPVGEIEDVLSVFETLLHSGEDGAEERGAALRDALVGNGEGYLKAGQRASAVLLFAKRRAGVRIENADTQQASLRIRKGWVTRSLAVMPVVRAQSVQFRRPVVHYFMKLASLQAHTVLGPVGMQIRGLSLGDARRMFEELSETVVRVQANDRVERAEQAGQAESAAQAAQSQQAEGLEIGDSTHASQHGGHAPDGAQS